MRRLGSLALVAASVLLVACSGSQVKGDGKVVTQARGVSQFNEVAANGNFVVTVNANQSKPSLTVRVDQNIQPYIMTAVKNKELIVSVKKGFNILPTQPIQIVANTKALDSAKVNGQTTFVANNLSGKLFDFEVNGKANSLLKGKVNAATVDINGAAQIDAKGLQSNNVSVNISGEGKVAVSVAKKLKVHIQGEGQVTYYGKPPVIQQAIYGGGQLIKGK